MRLKFLLALIATCLIALPANAYVGPGLGLGALGVIAGLFLSLVLAFFAFVWMPIKRAFTRSKTSTDEAAADEG